MDYIVSQQKILHKRPNPKIYRPLRAEKTTALPKIGNSLKTIEGKLIKENIGFSKIIV